MWMLAWLAAGALAQVPSTLAGVEVTPSGHRSSYDVTMYVRDDGNLYLGDDLVLDTEVQREVRRLYEADPNLRIVLSAGERAAYSRVVQVLDLVQSAGVGRVALEVGSAVRADDLLFPGLGSPDDVTELSDLSQEELKKTVAPRRHRFPQYPYGTTDFTAYTREKGETRVGLMDLSHGLLKDVQIGTQTLPNLFQAYNVYAKAHVLRAGRVDLAVGGKLYVVPVIDLANRFGFRTNWNIAGQKVKGKDTFVDNISYMGIDLTTSVQIAGGLSGHLGLGYGRARADGQLDFQNLPRVVLPGFDPIGGDVTLVSSVTGSLFDVRTAFDYRFNRRDSLILQAAATVYASARGGISGDIQGLPSNIENLDFIVGYGAPVPLSDTYRAAIAWQFSWRMVDLRVGIGSSAVSRMWWVQAFDLSYRFGGESRKRETDIQQGYRQNLDQLGGPED